MQCVNCGAELAEVSAFCNICGAPQLRQPPPPYAVRGRAGERGLNPSFGADMRGYWPMLLLPLFASLILPVAYLTLQMSLYNSRHPHYVMITSAAILITTAIGGLSTGSMVYACFTRSVYFCLLWLAPGIVYYLYMMILYGQVNTSMLISVVAGPVIWGIALLFGRAGGKFPHAGAGRLAAAAIAARAAGHAFSFVSVLITLLGFYGHGEGAVSMAAAQSFSPLLLLVSLASAAGGAFLFRAAYAKRRLGRG